MSRRTIVSAAVSSALLATLLSSAAQAAPANQNATANQDPEEHILVLGTAEDQVKQSLGVSVLTQEDIKRRPPANDLSELIRRMPGVNLTGNSASGQYGNNRQINLRGMGPENTLVLIDGKPVSARNSIRMGRSGERNTRGDTNWVPAEAVERIEVLRGPAAARYGSGAAGGVVNIITKTPTQAWGGSISVYGKQPEDDHEGDSKRASFDLSGGITKGLAFRLYGNINKTDADDLSLNSDFAANPDATPPAGREGVRNKDIDGSLRWDVTDNQVLELEAGFSRQGNIYAGDRAVSGRGSDLLTELANEKSETNVMYRTTASIAHRGDWSFGQSNLIFAFEQTRNHRANEGLAGGVEGSITDENEWSTSTLRNYELRGSVDVPFTLWSLKQTATIGGEWGRDELDDPYSMSQGLASGDAIDGISSGTRSGEAHSTYQAAYIEDNMELTLDWILTPGVRFDHNSLFGDNWSPYISTSYQLTDAISIHGGVAKAFKAPNLYQANPNYLWRTRGRGCPYDQPSLGGGCYILGNDDLEAETSVNKELGIEYIADGWTASIAWFRNDYKNKIQSGTEQQDLSRNDGRVFQWENAPKAIVEGYEGNLKIPLLGTAGSVLSWNTNFTYMDKNENEETGEPLSIIPRYTINSMLDWQATDALSFSFTLTRYGTQKPREITQSGAPATGEALEDREPYSVMDLGGSYEFNRHFRVSFGVKNLTDRRLYREDNSGGAGANTYNEPGRAYYGSVAYSF